jgi:site-specific recombinase XerD
VFKDAYAANTHKAYGQAVERFNAFLDGRKATDATVAAFLEAEAERGLAPATLSLIYAAIGAAARAADAEDPRGARTSRTLRRLKRRHADRGRGQADGLKREEVDSVARLATDEGGLAGLRDAALLRLGSDGFLRISELAAVRSEHLESAEDGSGCLKVPRSKTDQEGGGETLYVCRATMAAVAAWREASGVASGPLFRAVSRDGTGVGETAFSESAIRTVIRRRARAAGIEGRVTPHSLRIGSAQSLVARGASTAELMQAGRWNDPKTATRYAANELAASGAVAKYFEDE